MKMTVVERLVASVECTNLVPHSFGQFVCYCWQRGFHPTNAKNTLFSSFRQPWMDLMEEKYVAVREYKCHTGSREHRSPCRSTIWGACQLLFTHQNKSSSSVTSRKRHPKIPPTIKHYDGHPEGTAAPALPA